MRALPLLALWLAACAADGPAPGAPPARPAALASDAPLSVSRERFGAYWYRGLAEITTYDLTQQRYGAPREGTAALVYVTEPFSRRAQVKVDDAEAEGDDALTVLKLNATRQFVTGVYPYSMMTSVFTPVERAGEGPTLKVTTSAQEWCGHTFTQLNRISGGYRLRAHSYFEREGDRDERLPEVFLEDEAWTLLRLNPDALPTGRFRALPGTMYQRLSHTPFEPQDATATLAADPSDPALRVYTITYPALERTLAVTFRAPFPHEVERWAETYPDFGRTATTAATRRERRMLAYWTLNGPDDGVWRDSLKLN